MSIEWLVELERAIDGGKDVFACPGIAKNQWVIGKPMEELLKIAKRSADSRKIPTSIVRLIPKSAAIVGDTFLVPISIGEPTVRGEPQIEWRPIGARESAENMRDVKRGPAPYFGMQIETTINPS